MTRGEVARKLGVHPSTVQMLDRIGKLKGERVLLDGRLRVFYTEEAVGELIASGWKPLSPRAGKTSLRHAREERSRMARATAHFNAGKSAWEVAAICCLTLKEAAHYWQAWRRGPAFLLAQEREETLIKESIKWQKEQRQEEARDRWRKHREKIADLKTRTPAPILLVRREEVLPPKPKEESPDPKDSEPSTSTPPEHRSDR